MFKTNILHFLNTLHNTATYNTVVFHIDILRITNPGGNGGGRWYNNVASVESVDSLRRLSHCGL